MIAPELRKEIADAMKKMQEHPSNEDHAFAGECAVTQPDNTTAIIVYGFVMGYLAKSRRAE